VECFNKLVKDFRQLVMLKHEDCPGLGKLTQVRDTAKSENLRSVSILTGNGGLYLPQELERGADGAMTGFAYPEMLVEVVHFSAHYIFVYRPISFNLRSKRVINLDNCL
jgi:4-hydroxy-tetrahydrodipicolinate synthase